MCVEKLFHNHSKFLDSLDSAWTRMDTVDGPCQEIVTLGKLCVCLLLLWYANETGNSDLINGTRKQSGSHDTTASSDHNVRVCSNTPNTIEIMRLEANIYLSWKAGQDNVINEAAKKTHGHFWSTISQRPFCVQV